MELAVGSRQGPDRQRAPYLAGCFVHGIECEETWRLRQLRRQQRRGAGWRHDRQSCGPAITYDPRVTFLGCGMQEQTRIVIELRKGGQIEAEGIIDPRGEKGKE